MTILRLILFGLLCTPQVFSIAHGKSLTPEELSCSFRQPVIIGASVTTATPSAIPLYKTAITALAIKQKRRFFLPDFGPSPTNLFFNLYAKLPLSTKVTNLARSFTNSEEHLGSSQVRSLLGGEHRQTFDEASVVIGLDAFYWDAIWDTCSYGAHNGGVEAVIEDLIQDSQNEGKALILGTVPNENPANVLIDSEALGIDGLWYQPEPRCVHRINMILTGSCKTEHNCYLVDLYSIAEVLNSGKKIRLSSGAEYDLLQMRPDGVHLSTYGARYVFEEIIQKLEDNPPKCKK